MKTQSQMSGVDSDGSNEDDSDEDTEIKASDLIVSLKLTI